MLLTSGQISMTISSGIVFIFTSLLFLSGYVLQQQTVRNLQAAIRPPPPPPSPSASASVSAVARIFGDPPGSRGRVAYEEYLTESRPKGGWKKVAYVQLVREHLHVCSAVMLFAELARQKSKAERVLLYPKVWDRVGDRSQEPMDRYGETSRRLLNMAADRYGVVLRPREPTPDEANVRSSSTHSLAELLALTDYKRILHLQPSGLLLNSTELDRLLASSSKNLSRADPSTMTSKSNTSKQPLLITPSREAFDRAREDITAKPIPDTELLPHLIQEQDRILPSSTIHRSDNLVFESSSFHTQPPSFDAESFLTSTSYVHFSDPDLPGPEYYIPHDLFLRRPPGDSEARMVWQSMYERFRDLRMSVCGLDLEPMPREEVKPPDVRDAVSELSAHVR